jgi:hypothetical protein
LEKSWILRGFEFPEKEKKASSSVLVLWRFADSPGSSLDELQYSISSSSSLESFLRLFLFQSPTARILIMKVFLAWTMVAY